MSYRVGLGSAYPPTGMGITLLGAGGHARVIIAATKAAGLTISRILDDNESSQGTEILGVPVTGRIAEFKDGPAFIGIGSNIIRSRLDAAFPSAEWAVIIHPASFVDPTVDVGPGTLICAGAVVQPECVLGRHVIINTSSSVDHECHIASYAQVAPGAHLGGRITLGEGAMAGIGSSIHQGSKMGAWSTLGGGAFLKGSLDEGVVAVGIPARPLVKR